MSEEEGMKGKSVSPTEPGPGGKDEKKIETMSFVQAIQEIVNGRKVSRVEWADKNYYALLTEGRIKLHKPDGALNEWVISDGDAHAEDWIAI